MKSTESIKMGKTDLNKYFCADRVTLFVKFWLH